MDDASWKNHGSQNDSKINGLDVEGSSSSKWKMKGIDYLRSSKLFRLSENTNVPEDGCFEHGKRIDSASSTINLDKKKREVIVSDSSFRHMHNIEGHLNRHLSSQQMDDASSKNHGNQHDFKNSGLKVEGSSSKKKMKNIDYLRSSELSRLSENTNVPGDGCFEHGKRIDNASSTNNLDKKKREVIVSDNSFRHMNNIEAHSNRSGLACRRHSFTNTSSLPYEEVNSVSFMIRKRKSDVSNLCESSSVASETIETSCNKSSRLDLSDGWSSISSRNNSYDCDIKLDELQSPKLSLDNHLEQNLRFDDYSARISQIEADELLARNLQEQYNEEVAGTTSTNERVRSMTDSYACSAQLASHNSSSWSSNRSQHQSSDSRRSFHSPEINFETREKNMPDLHAYYTHLASHNSSARSSIRSQHQMSNARRSFHCPEIELETKLVGELKNIASMDSEKRRNLLEALQAAFDQSNSAFDNDNDDDYDMMLSLDKSACASEEQINSLPQSIIQSGKAGEMCVICLEVPSFGDEIRHLPCLHKFHLKCIDVWLRRKACCPVCKWKFS